MQLDQSTIIVTGAGSGMGRHFALRFAQLGANVAAADIDSEALSSLAVDAEMATGTIEAFRCDVANEADVISLIEGTWDRFGAADGLVNNAGIFRDGLLVKQDDTGAVQRMSLASWQAVLDVDLTGPFLCTREFAAQCIEHSRPGVVVNISSISRHGNVGQSNYSAAKAGLIADTALWARELARYNIRVGAIAPGFIETPILAAMRPAVLERMVRSVPMGRTGTCEEIFQGVQFIFACDYFTGRCIDIDGGLTI